MNPHATYEVTKRVRRVKVPLSKRAPEEWLERIKELPADLQPVIARVVWWDYFGSRISKEAWPHLDRLRELPMGDTSDNAQRDALRQIGYNIGVVTKRVGPRRY